MNILVAASSTDSIRLIEKLSGRGHKITAINMDRRVFDLLMKTKGIRIVSGAATAEDFSDTIVGSKIDVIVDESSPFSTIVSPALMEAAKLNKCVYCRYEGKIFDVRSANVITAKDHPGCVEILNARDGGILLAIGTAGLEEYVSVRDYKKRLYVLGPPLAAFIEKCQRLDIPAAHIIAVQGAVSKDLLVSLIAHSRAAVLVSKDTGAEAGIEGKVQAAEESGIPIVLIDKPEIMYINKFKATEEILRFIENAALAAKGG